MTAPPSTVGRYQLLDLLATGGMGEVYVARQRSSIDAFVKLVAIKLLPAVAADNPEMVTMFLAEARAAARIHHRNIVEILDVDHDDGRYFQAMEYIPGWTLRELLAMRTITDAAWMPLRAIVRMFTELAEALAKAHDAGLIHRDVSPSNIMISEAGVPKLIDFGIARGLEDGGLTQPGTLKGKYAYMAPEYIRGHAYDRRVDLFALGIVMWETLTRTKLFRGNNAADLLMRVLDGPVPRLDEAPYLLPSVLADVVATALERDPDRRFGSAHAMAEALEKAEHELVERGGNPSLARWLIDAIPEELAQLRERELAWHAIPSSPPSGDSHRGSSSNGRRAGAATRNLQVVRAEAAPTEPPPLVPDAALAQGHSVPSATSLAQAAGAAYAPPPTAVAAPGRRRAAAIGLGALGALAVAAVVTWQLQRTASTPAPPPVAAVTTPVAAEAVTPAQAAEVHRRLAVAAMEAKDWEGARAELAVAIAKLGPGDAAVRAQLTGTLAIVDDLARGDAPAPPAAPDPAPAPASAVPPAPTAAAPPRADGMAARGHKVDAERPAASRVATSATPAVPEVVAGSQSTLVVTSNVAGLPVLLDGRPVGVTPFKGKVASGRHQLGVSDGSRLLESRTIEVRDEFATFDVKAPEVAVAPPPPPPPPVERPAPPPIDAGVAVAARAARTPRVAAATLGDAHAGAAAIAGACNACHARVGAPRVAGGMKTAEQWVSFFANGRHDDFVRLGDQVTAGELAAIKAYLLANAHGARDCGIAGMKECN